MKNQAKKWDEAIARHDAAATAFRDTASLIRSDSWFVPLAEGKWSPAQVAEHLSQTYRVVICELRGEKGIRIRSPWFLRQVLRQTVLRSIYRKRKLPKGARAPSEIAPKVVDETKQQAVEKFIQLAREFKAAARAAEPVEGRKLTHHIFGEIDVLPGIDFIAIHIEHHHRQIQSVVR
jgi:DinB superfamily